MCSITHNQMFAILNAAGYGVIGFSGYKKPEDTAIIFREAYSEYDVIKCLKQMNMSQFQDSLKLTAGAEDTEPTGHLVALFKNGAIQGGILLLKPISNDQLKELFTEAEGVKICLLPKEKSNLVPMNFGTTTATEQLIDAALNDGDGEEVAVLQTEEN